MKQSATIHPITHNAKGKEHRYYHVQRRFSTQRPTKELVRDLLRAHSGK